MPERPVSSRSSQAASKNASRRGGRARTPVGRTYADQLEGGSARQLFAEHYEIQENPGGGAPNAATAAQEREWGQQFASELRASGIPELTDPEIAAYVRDLCEQLVPVAKGFPRQYELTVLDSPVVNAQTTPGYIFVYRGLLDLVTSEAELVGVLGHEMGHTIGHHAGKAAEAVQQVLGDGLGVL